MEAKDTTHNSSSSSLDEYAIGVGAGSRRVKNKSVASASTSIIRPLNRSDIEKWPKDIPKEYTECMKDHNNILREAIHQGKFRLCWAVALSRCLEALIFLRSKEVVHLSAQHLVNNIRNKEEKKGSVTKYNEIRDFMKNVGLVPESYCPYTGKINVTCSKSCQKCDKPAYQIKDLIYMKGKDVNEEELIKIVRDGPILAVVEVYDSFHNLKDGIYAGPTDKEMRKTKVGERHVVVVSGYGSTAEGVHYWKILNSWGTWWGENGFGKIMRKSSRGGNKPSLLRKVILLTV